MDEVLWLWATLLQAQSHGPTWIAVMLHDPLIEFGVSLDWEEDDCQGQLLSVAREAFHQYHISPEHPQERRFLLGVTCAFLSCSASMTHRLIDFLAK